MKHRYTVMVILALSMMLLSAECALAGFVVSGGNTLYQTDDGKYLTGPQEIDGQLYYFDDSGILQRGGWINGSNGKIYYANDDGTLVRNQWVMNNKYYINSKGERASGSTDIGGKLYYFSPSTGKILKGKLKDAAGNIYITNSKGVLYANKFFRYKSKKYYAGADGALARGLVKIGNHYYYFKPKNGIMVTNTKKSANGAVYYLQKNGKAATNTWVKIKKKYYYFEADGKMATNKYIGTNWYVNEKGVRIKASKAPKKGLVNQDGKYYCYDTAGNLLTNQWYQNGSDMYYAGADGAIVIGVYTIGTDQYYFDQEGKLLRNTVVAVNGNTYTVDGDGRITGTTTTNGAAISEFAQKYVGNPYVYGGTSLTNGADCSGFCYAVFGTFGIQLMRVADDQMDGPTAAYIAQGYKQGTVISDAALAPGDLVFYGSADYATHVAIYIGDNKVVHACNTKLGIIISDIDYVHDRVHDKNMRYWA